MIDLSTIPLADLVAEVARRGQSRRNLSTAADQIIAAEAASSGIAESLIRSRRRPRPVARARMRCMASLYHLGFSSPEIGLHFDRSHGAVLHALKVTA
jgi:chromosomal replication initiation ATPase DnaA